MNDSTAEKSADTASVDPRAIPIASKVLELHGLILGEAPGVGAQAFLESAATIFLSIFDMLLPIIVRAVVIEYDSARNIDTAENEKA